MNAALTIWPIDGSGPLVRIDKHDLPDLDDLMLEIFAHPEVQCEVRYWWYDDDPATCIPGGSAGEAEVGFFRKNPCACGDGHTFDMGYVGMDDEGNAVGSAARGAFLGVYFQ